MDINTNTSMVNHNRYSGANTTASTAAKGSTDTAAAAVEAEPKTQLEEIRDKGFGAYVDELKARKKEELRAKILGEMKLTEEALSKMSPENRAQIEKMISAEIVKRSTAESQLDQNNKSPLSRHSANQPQSIDPSNIKIDAAGVGLGPLLALQEIEQKAEQQGGKRDDPTG